MAQWTELTVSTGDTKVIRGQGMPSYRHHDFGNLYVQFDVKFPKFEPQPGMTEVQERERLRQIQKLQQLHAILPPPASRAEPDEDAMVENYPLESIAVDQQARASGAGLMDEEDDDLPPGAERMQCASQ